MTVSTTKPTAPAPPEHATAPATTDRSDTRTPGTAEASAPTTSSARPPRRKARHLVRRCVALLGSVVTTVLVLAVLAMGVAKLFFGVQFISILTGSMSPGMPKGALAVTAPIDPTDIKEGDVIAFMPPQPWTPSDGNPVVHRVLKLGTGSDGHTEMQTKGDANDAPDPWTIDLSEGGDFDRRLMTVQHGGQVARELHETGPLGIAALGVGLMAAGWGVRQLRPHRDAEVPNESTPSPEGSDK